MRHIQLAHTADFVGWRSASRQLLLEHVPPEELVWSAGTVMQDLFAGYSDSVDSAGTAARDAPASRAASGSPLRVPPDFLSLAEYAVCHRDEDRFALLYRVLWRATHGESAIFVRRTDDDVHRLHELRKAVARDRHKMTAFVRFRQVPGCREQQFSAWFEPDHHILRLTSPFFCKRFTNMCWSIFTPECSAHWNGKSVAFGPAGTRQSVPEGEEMEELWKTYFASIFNPARLRLDAMRAEMPVKYWKNLPEAPLIAKLTREAGSRTGKMVDSAPSVIPRFAHKAVSPKAPAYSAASVDLVPARSLEELREQVRDCAICPHACDATQAVMGQGPMNAALMLIGEQPGDREDLRGRPFVGPAGQLLRQVMEELEIDVETVYLTNAVKHFSYTVRGKRRLHERPDLETIDTCRRWLFEEIGLVRPKIIVALGATAGRALLRRPVQVERERGVLHSFGSTTQWLLSAHPSHVLRTRNPDAQAALRARLKADLTLASDALIC